MGCNRESASTLVIGYFGSFQPVCLDALDKLSLNPVENAEKKLGDSEGRSSENMSSQMLHGTNGPKSLCAP